MPLQLPGIVASSHQSASGGGSVRFNASGQHFSRSASGLTLVSSDVTWCAWAKMEVANSYAMVLSTDNANDKYAQFGAAANGVRFFLSNGEQSSYDFEIGTWAFIAAAIDRTMADGWIYWGEEGFSSLSEQFIFNNPTTHFDAANTFYIGNDGFGDRWQGSVAAVKVWNARLTEAELLDESETYAAQRTSGLWAAYSFENGPQTTDDSGNGRTLTMTGTPVLDTDGPPIS